MFDPNKDIDAVLIACLIAMHKLNLPHNHPDVVAEMNRLMEEYDRSVATKEKS